MNLLKLNIVIVISIFLYSCVANQNTRDASLYAVPVNDFSRTVELLIANEEFLEAEIMKINALNPSIQRIILGADDFLKKENYTKANSELERAFRLTKSEGALYLRIAHLRYKQGLLMESESFASRGLLLGNISSWERLLLNVYLKN